MSRIVWVMQSGMEPFAGGQQQAFRCALESAGHQLTVQRYQPRTPWRQQGRCDWLVWSFVPTHLDVWSARLFAARQMAVIHEAPAIESSLPELDGWCVPSESLRMQLIDLGVGHERISISAGYVPSTGKTLTRMPERPLIYVGGPLNKAMGNHQAVWSLSILQFLHPSASMVIHDEGDDGDRVKQLAFSSCMEVSVTVAGANAGVHQLVEKADVVFLPRLTDGVPDAMFSALLLGKPIVATAQPSMKEWLRHEENALLVASDQAAVWTAAMDRLMNDAELVERFGRGGRSRVVPGERVRLPEWMEVRLGVAA